MPSNLDKIDSKEDLQEQVISQLRMIEVSHDITISNLMDIARMIIANVKNSTDALQVCTAINTWIAINDVHGNVIVPEPLVRKYMKKVISQRV